VSWWVEYSAEAATYLEDNGDLVSPLFFAMEALPDHRLFREQQIPMEMSGIFVIELVGHRVYFRRNDTERTLMIESIKPLADNL